MSDFQRAIFQKKLRQAEAALGFDFSEDAEENEGIDQGRSPEVHETSTDVSPGLWKDYFEENVRFTDGQGNAFNAYYTLPEGAKAPVFVFHHGAGSAGLTFAMLCKELTRQFAQKDAGRPGFLVFDFRGHGKTSCVELDFSRDRLVKDFCFVVKLYLKLLQSKHTVVFVGHSLGGLVLTSALETFGLSDDEFLRALVTEKIVKGLVMYDIVEATAIQSLGQMHRFISSRPQGFDLYREAIDWHVRCGFLRNRESAAVSVPALLKKGLGRWKYTWSADLKATEPYWNTWFNGLSEGFVRAPVQAKLLVLAGNDSLDKSLMIGQMQGKYQLIVFTDSGHFVHEDQPTKTAISVLDFWERNFSLMDKKIPILWGTMRNE